MDLQTAEKVVAKQKETDAQFAAAQEVLRLEERRKVAERQAEQSKARAERERAGLLAVVAWLDTCNAGADMLRAEHGAAFEQAMSTGAIPHLVEGGLARLPLRQAIEGLAFARGALAERLEAMAEED